MNGGECYHCSIARLTRDIDSMTGCGEQITNAVIGMYLNK
jgi:hypothetical protein